MDQNLAHHPLSQFPIPTGGAVVLVVSAVRSALRGRFAVRNRSFPGSD